MHHRTTLALASVLLAAATLFARPAGAAAAADGAAAGGGDGRRMNLLLIAADDMNGDSPGWMGNPHRATPRLDAFAGTAHRFVNAHVSAPICQPSRSAFMTGLVPHRSGALGFDPVRAGTPTLVTVLQKAGYFAAVVDKHEHMAPADAFPWDLKLTGGGKNPPVMRRHVEAALRAAAGANKPFFLNANITDPHRPFPGAAPAAAAAAKGKAKGAAKGEGKGKKKGKAAGGELADADATDRQPALPTRVFAPADVAVPSFLEDVPDLRQEVAQYYTAVARMDETFDAILGAVRAAGREQDTTVVFLSDHGISMPFAKATVYRNGTWSPVLLRWPGTGEPQVRKELVSTVDLVPTLLELLRVPPLQEQDGRSWLPLLRGESQPGRDHVVTHVNTVNSGTSLAQRCVRTADASLMFHAWADGTPKFRVEAMNGLAFKAMADAAGSDPRMAGRVRQFQVGAPLAFYDLRTDPDERQNLIGDPARRPDVDRLAKLLLAHMERTSDSQAEAFRKAVAALPAAAGR